MAKKDGSIIETIDELEKNISLVKKIGDIAEKGNSEQGDAGNANTEIINLLKSAGITDEGKS